VRIGKKEVRNISRKRKTRVLGEREKNQEQGRRAKRRI